MSVVNSIAISLPDVLSCSKSFAELYQHAWAVMRSDENVNEQIDRSRGVGQAGAREDPASPANMTVMRSKIRPPGVLRLSE